MAELKIIDMKKGKLNPHLSFLVLGASGVGKTTCLTTAPKPILVAAIEGGVTEAALIGTEVDVIHVRTWEDARTLVGELRQPDLEKNKVIKKKYATVALDGLTELAEILKTYILKFAWKKTGEKEPAVTPRLALTIPDWGTFKHFLSMFVKTVRELPCSVIFTCLDKAEKDEETGVVWRVPNIQGAYRDKVISDVNVAVWLEVADKGVRYFRCISDSRHNTKSRREFNAQEPVNISKLLDKVFKPEPKKEAK